MPGQVKTVSVNERAAEQGRQFQTRQFDHRQQGIAEGMAQHHGRVPTAPSPAPCG